jgi:hypothetical protein
MLKNQEIVYVTSDWQTENRTSTHHIAEELSRHNRLLYVEAAGMRSPQASRRDARKIARKILGFLRRPREVAPNIHVYSPVILPFHRFAVVRAINRFLLALAVRWAISLVRFERPILWIFMPHFASLVDDIPYRGLVYYVTDEYTATPNVDRDRIERMEARILEKADVVFVVSERLRERKSRLNPNVHVSRHGVDTAHFRRAADGDTPVPNDIADISRPIAGFFGLIEKYVDLKLLEFAARRLPHVSFVMIGHAAKDVSVVARLPNVHFLGRKPYDELPGYLKVFDVCLLLYEVGPFSMHANPKKLREYIAGGKPVVSVRIGEVERYGDLVYISDTYDEYVDNISRALEEDSDKMMSARLKCMQTESWDAKVELIGDLVAEHVVLSTSDRAAEV